MRALAILFGVGTAVGIVAGVSAAPVESGMQLAQAQQSGGQSGAQSGTGTGASQRGSAGTREGGAAAAGASQERGAARASPVMARLPREVRPLERAAPPFVSVPAAPASPCMAVRAGWLACAPRPATMPSSSDASGRAAMSIAGRPRR